MYASFGARWRARGDHSPLTTPRQPLCSFYIVQVERAARARAFGCHCSCFRSRFASLFRDDSRLCRRSAFVCRHSPSRLCSALLSSLVWSLLCTSLSSALLVLLCLSSRHRLFCVRLCFCIRLYSAFARRSRLSTLLFLLFSTILN